MRRKVLSNNRTRLRRRQACKEEPEGKSTTPSQFSLHRYCFIMSASLSPGSSYGLAELMTCYVQYLQLGGKYTINVCTGPGQLVMYLHGTAAQSKLFGVAVSHMYVLAHESKRTRPWLSHLRCAHSRPQYTCHPSTQAFKNGLQARRKNTVSYRCFLNKSARQLTVHPLHLKSAGCQLQTRKRKRTAASCHLGSSKYLHLRLLCFRTRS